MPGCVLRIASTTPDAEPLIKVSGLRPIAVWRKGEPRWRGSKTLNPGSGFNVNVSEADGDLVQQAKDAIRFLKRHDAGLRRLRRHNGFGHIQLDFAAYDRTSEKYPWPCYRLPALLIEHAGKHAMEIALSFYGPGPGTP